jgi:hypothetical protein
MAISGNKLVKGVQSLFKNGEKFSPSQIKEAGKQFGKDVQKTYEHLVRPAANSVDDVVENVASIAKESSIKTPKGKFKAVNKTAPQVNDAAASAVKEATRLAEEKAAQLARLSERKTIDSVTSGKNFREAKSVDEFAQIGGAKKRQAGWNEEKAMHDAIDGGTFTKDQAKGYGIPDDGFDDFMKDKTKAKEHVTSNVAERNSKITDEVGLGDKWGYNRGTEKAIAVGSTAWLVSKMSASKGQMSNAGLYGQSQGY